MAYGGGTFISQNKELPGAYINFVSVASATATLSERGAVAMPLELDWGVDDEIFTVTNEDFQKRTMAIFGYSYTDDRMKGLRDLFLNCQTLYAYKLTSGGGRAENEYARALYGGIRGNDLKIVIQTNVDDGTMFDVTTIMGTSTVDEQVVGSAADLVDNDYVTFKKDAELGLTAGDLLSGGSNGEVDGGAWQAFCDKAEAFTFNIAAAVTTDSTVKSLFSTWVKRLRDEVGMKFQCVLYRYTSPDYMGVISVENAVTDGDWDESSLIYWVAGLEAACAVNRSCQNTAYNGEFTVSADYTQTELKTAVKSGQFILHRVGDAIRVLDDINTMVTTSDDCGEVFEDNQTIRVIDQIATDVASLFVTKYLGVVPNDAAGRISLWSDIVKLHNELNDLRAIENFDESDITVDQGDSKKSVVVSDVITVVNAMSKLYMTVTVQ